MDENGEVVDEVVIEKLKAMNQNADLMNKLRNGFKLGQNTKIAFFPRKDAK